MSPKIAVVHTAIQPEERHCTGAHLTTSPEIPVHDFLANIPLLRDASPEEIERMAAGTRRVYAQKGEALFRRGDPCEGFWIVLYGQIKLLVTSPQGMEKVIEIVGPGLTFGEAIMFTETACVVNAHALADSLLLHVSKKTVFAELERNPAFARKMLAGLSRRLHGLIRDVESYSMRSGTERVIGFLMRNDTSENDEESNEATVTLPASKVTIASRLNLTPEHFSRILHDLSAAGLIEVSGKTIHVPDLKRLRDFQG
ncbi:MAG: Crp/Fnr family transcriptional regulator [Betaproteobacteria bacterium]|nr:Crp/Fnr family transcriptional regulator [Betaproteobacteria bacterium]